MRSPLERHRQHRQARGLVVIGLVATVAYLAVRVATTLAGAPLLLSLPALTVEVFGGIASGLLAWALWPTPREAHPSSLARPTGAPVDVLVLADQQSESQVRATLLALESVGGVGRVVVADGTPHASLAAVAAERGATYRRVANTGPFGTECGSDTVESEFLLVLEAGDIPSGDILEILSPHMALDVAVVQGLGVEGDLVDAADRSRVPDLAFERSSLNPSLGRRGLAFWLGSGSLVRQQALHAVTAAVTADSRLEARWAASTLLHAAGWRIVAPDDSAVVAHRRLAPDGAVHRDRVERASAALSMLVDGRHPTGERRAARRAAQFAWAIRPISGLRRLVLIAVITASLVTGAAPLSVDTPALAVLWLPAALYTGLGIVMLSDQQLRLGDRTRWALHSMGPAVRAAVSRFRRSTRPSAPLATTQHGSTLVVSTLVLGVGLIVRALSERLQVSSSALDSATTVLDGPLLVVVVVAATLIAGSVEIFRGTSRQSQVRRATRVPTSLAATVDGWAVHLADLTTDGAGVLSLLPMELGSRVHLVLDLPTSSGITSAQTMAVVRNLGELPSGEWRLGLEFENPPLAVREALSEFCIVEPMRHSVMAGGLAPEGVDTGIELGLDQRAVSGEDTILSGPTIATQAVRLVSVGSFVAAVVAVLPEGLESVTDALTAMASAVSVSMVVTLVGGLAFHLGSRSRTLVGHGH